MNISERIQNLDMEIDSRFYQKPLIEALDLYHSLIEKKIITPRENQLVRNDMIQPNVHFNVKEN